MACLADAAAFVQPHEEMPKFYNGAALVFMGTFHTVNSHYATEYASGIYQAVQVEFYDDAGFDEAPEGAYVARPNEVYFRFIKPAEAAYKSS